MDFDLKEILCEVCIDSVASALNAIKGGARRVELCDNLFEGGTTPSYGMIRTVQERSSAIENSFSNHVGIHVIIRPRGGDFCYNDDEFDVMKEDIRMCKELGIDGVVFGILLSNGSVDIERNKILTELSRPMKVTFHRAFDMTKDPLESLECLIDLGVDRILTSGQESTCLEGLDLLSELVKKAGNRIIIMPGGGITERNVKKIVSTCKAQEIHVSGRTTSDSTMEYRNSKAFMGGALRPSEFSLSIVDDKKIQNFINCIN